VLNPFQCHNVILQVELTPAPLVAGRIRHQISKLFAEANMADGPDYISLSKRFESLAQRSSDPLLADAYRKLAKTYRALDFWHERFRQRYEHAISGAATNQDGSGDPAHNKHQSDES
jgi:hypothetical protein